MKSSIVIDVPPQENIGFIAIPFSDNFSIVSGKIAEALTKSKMTPYRVDQQKKSPNFVSEILAKIQACVILVVVCSPENKTGTANPNVMYEIGLGRSVGKPMLILTNNIDSLPADLKGEHVVLYADDEVESDNFINKICVEISIVKERLINGYIDKSYSPSIWVGKDPHLLLRRNDMWSDFTSVLFYAKDIHNRFQEYDSAHLNHIHHCIEELYTGGVPPKNKQQKQVDFSRFWNNYKIRFDANSEFWKTHENNKNKTEFLDRLGEVGDDEILLIVDRCKEYVETISEQIDNFVKYHGDICILTKDGVTPILDKPDSVSNLLGNIGQLSQYCKGIVIHADTLILNIISIMELGVRK